MQFTQYHPQFFTATNLEWKPLLKEDKHKDIVINSLRFLVKNNGVKIYSFVTMPNHLHPIWQIQAGHERQNVQRDFLKFTAQQICFNIYCQKHITILQHCFIIQALIIGDFLIIGITKFCC